MDIQQLVPILGFGGLGCCFLVQFSEQTLLLSRREMLFDERQVDLLFLRQMHREQGLEVSQHLLKLGSDGIALTLPA